MTVLYISPPGLWLKPFKFTKSKSTEYLFLVLSEFGNINQQIYPLNNADYENNHKSSHNYWFWNWLDQYVTSCHTFLKVSLLENVIRSKFTYYFAICGFFILPKYHTWFSFHMLPFKGHISARKCYYTKIYILFCDLQILYFVKTFFYIFYIFLQTENLWRHNVHYHILKGTL